MKQLRLVSVLLAAVISVVTEAQVPIMDDVFLKCSYEYKSVKDSVKHEQKEDLVLLLIGKSHSAFYSYYTFQTDSLRLSPDYQIKWRQAFLTAFQKDGAAATNFYFRRLTSYTYKDFLLNTIKTYDDVNNSLFVYEDTLDAQQWELMDSIKIVLGYICQKAETVYHGRIWTAWFAADIPIDNGPWKLGGLPGLIMEAYDANNEHHFTMNGLQQVNHTPIIDKSKEGKYKRTTRIKFLKAKRDFEENSARIIQAQTDVSLDFDASSKTIHRDYLETDYK